MTDYPVNYHAKPPRHFSAVQLALRLVVFIILGMFGLSFGLSFVFLYLALPAYAAARIQSGGAQRYLDEDGPRIVHMLRWVAAVYAWAGLVVDRLPQNDPTEVVALTVDQSRGAPTPGSALWRLLAGLPGAALLLLVGIVGVFVWLWAALLVLFSGRVGAATHAFLEGMQRLCLRLLAYQASLVEAYPPATLQNNSSHPGFPHEA